MGRVEATGHASCDQTNAMSVSFAPPPTEAMEFFVYSRAAIERVPPHDVPHVVISITSADDDVARIPASTHCIQLLRLSFLDAHTPPSEPGRGVLFSREHARVIWDAVLAHHEAVQRIVLHCDAGLSRSPAVAAAIAKALLGDDAELFRRYRPNLHVYRTLLETFDDEYKSRFGGTGG